MLSWDLQDSKHSKCMYTCGKRCLPYRSDLLFSKHIRCGHTPEKWRSGLSAEASFFYFGSVPNPLFLKATIILTEVHLLFFANYQHPFLIKKDVIVFKEALNNLRSFCPHPSYSPLFPLVKAISAQNGHYCFAFLLPFLKKSRPPLYQVVERFRPAIARAYKLAQANIAYSRFSVFFRPRYTVFL